MAPRFAVLCFAPDTRDWANRMQAAIERTPGQMVERIVKRFAPEKIILFGSHATGSAGPDSDVDLLVVMTPNRSKAAQEPDILRVLRRYRMPKDVIVTTLEDFAWRSKIPGTIERPAARGAVPNRESHLVRLAADYRAA